MTDDETQIGSGAEMHIVGMLGRRSHRWDVGASSPLSSDILLAVSCYDILLAVSCYDILLAVSPAIEVALNGTTTIYY